MFVVAGLHTKRRPLINVDDSRARTGKQGVESPVTTPHSFRSYPAKLSSSSSGQAAPSVSERRMCWRHGEKDACDRSEKSRCPFIRVPLGRSSPTRVRKFIPKPLILVERMKTRQFLLDSSPSVSTDSSVTPESSRSSRSMTARTPLSTHVTPSTHRIPTCNVLSSGSRSSSSISFQMLARNDAVFGSECRTMPRLAKPFKLSIPTPTNSSSSTNTFVADSPCCLKQASRVPVLAVTGVHFNVKSDPDRENVADTSAVDSIAVDLHPHQTCQSSGIFEPAMTSTPFSSSQPNADPMSFAAPTVHSSYSSEQMLGLPEGFEVASPTSQAVYPFNIPKGEYIVKLPNFPSAVSLSNRVPYPAGTAVPRSRSARPTPLLTSANAPRPNSAIYARRLSDRAASPSPTLVLDGVFALPRASPPSPPRRSLGNFPRPRKPAPRRPLSNMSNTLAIALSSRPLLDSAPPVSSEGQSGPASPRSKLAHVLTAHVRSQQTQTADRTRQQACLPPLVRGIEASSDPRTRCEIEGLRVRKTVGFQVGHSGASSDASDGDGCGKGAIERMSLASVGMVAKLRARWEAGSAEHRGTV